MGAPLYRDPCPREICPVRAYVTRSVGGKVGSKCATWEVSETGKTKYSLEGDRKYKEPRQGYKGVTSLVSGKIIIERG